MNIGDLYLIIIKQRRDEKQILQALFSSDAQKPYHLPTEPLQFALHANSTSRDDVHNGDTAQQDFSYFRLV
jgi:hypothetical protein